MTMAIEEAADAMDAADAGSATPLDADDQLIMDDDEQIVEMVADDSVQGFFRHTESVYTLSVNPRCKNIVVSGGGDDVAYVWSSINGCCLARCCGHSDSVVASGFSADGQFLATGSMDSTVRIWRCNDKWIDEITREIATQTENILDIESIATLEASSEIVWIQWHPVGNVLLAGAADGSAWMWSVPTGEVMNVFYGHSMSNNAGCFYPPDTGKMILTVSQDGTVCMFDPRVAEPQSRLSLIDTQTERDDGEDDGEGWNCVACRKDGTIAAIGGTRGVCKIIALKNANIVTTLTAQSGNVESVAFCDTQPFLVAASVDGTIAVYDTEKWTLRSTLRHDDAVVFVQFIKSSSLLVSASIDQTLRKWDARSGEVIQTWTGHQDSILCCAVAEDRIIAAGDDKLALCFEIDPINSN